MSSASANVIIKTNRGLFAAKLEHSYRCCARIAQASGSNFYLGMLLTPKDKRNAMFAVYAWMREIDDIADSQINPREKIKQLIQFYRQTERVIAIDEESEDALLQENYWLAFRQTIIDYQIPERYLKEMFYGQLQTIKQKTFKTFSDLYQYCYRVASTVGLICIKIWGYQGGEQTEKLAEYRGIALQLTNILRDVYQDAAEGQIFIPDEFFVNKHLTPKEIMLNKNQVIKDAIHKIIVKAAYYYKMSEKLEQYVARDGLLCLQVMTNVYHSLFNKIKRNPHSIFCNKRVGLSHLSKFYICLSSGVKFYLGK